jgi:hypothetical protein
VKNLIRKRISFARKRIQNARKRHFEGGDFWGGWGGINNSLSGTQVKPGFCSRKVKVILAFAW